MWRNIFKNIGILMVPFIRIMADKTLTFELVSLHYSVEPIWLALYRPRLIFFYRKIQRLLLLDFIFSVLMHQRWWYRLSVYFERGTRKLFLRGRSNKRRFYRVSEKKSIFRMTLNLFFEWSQRFIAFGIWEMYILNVWIFIL